MRNRQRRLVAAILTTIAWLWCASSVARAEALRVRIAWGEGTARQWSGKLSLNQGQLRLVRSLGLAPDTPGSAYSTGPNVIVIGETSPRRYDGLDIDVDAPINSILDVELASRGGPPQKFAVDISELVTNRAGIGRDLDAAGNRLLLRRAPGDMLRFEINRPHLVFAPREPIIFTAQAHLLADLGLANQSVVLRARLLRADTSRQIGELEEELQLDGQRSASPLDFRFDAPLEEGVYNLELSLQQRRQLGFRLKLLYRRLVQLVVVHSQPTINSGHEWREQFALDPSRNDWLDWIADLPGIESIPGMKATPGQSNTQVVRRGGQEMIEIKRSSWVAYPLTIADEDLNRPHILEIQYPADVRQTFGVSVLEVNRAQSVTPMTVDSGVDVGDRISGPPIEVHRVVFWPRTTSPYVLLTNQRAEQAALISKIRVLSGPDHLPSSRTSRVEGRLAAAYFAEPLFPEAFHSDEAADIARPPHGSLDDWLTFYRGAVRLAEHLKYAGQNAAVVCVAREGGSLYGSDLLAPTPRYDNGLFFATAQDPLQKDVVEMMFRIFDRDGLKLIPAIHLSGSIPALEALRRREGGAAITLRGAEGQHWFRKPPAFYNPLHPHVQGEIHRIVEELEARYGHHPSFGGVALQLGPDTSIQLPDVDWGIDDQTIAQFERDTQIVVPGDKLPTRLSFLRGKGRSAWLQWRADRLSQWHRRLQTSLQRRRTEAKLIIAGADAFAWHTLQATMQPDVKNRGLALRDMFLRVGMDPQLYRDSTAPQLLRPYREGAVVQLVASGGDLRLNQSSPRDEAAFRGAVIYQPAVHKRLGDFDRLNPFGDDVVVRTRLQSQISASGFEQRRRFVRALHRADLHTLIDGGPRPGFGQEDEVVRLLEAYRALPAEKFDDLPPAMEGAATDLVAVRTLQGPRATYLYVVNQAPWSMRVQIALDAPPMMPPISLPDARPVTAEADPRGSVIQLQLNPYDLFVIAGQMKPSSWRAETPPAMVKAVQGELLNVKSIAAKLQASPVRAAPPNLDFQAPVVGNGPPGWRSAMGANALFQVKQVGDGGQFVQMKLTAGRNPPVLWCRSEKFAAPQTGMLAVSVRMKAVIPPGGAQPNLAVALDTMDDVHYDPIFIGLNGVNKLTNEWRDLVFRFPIPANLPPAALGFDLRGPGEVWIDDIKLYDVWLEPGEKSALMFNSGRAIEGTRDGEIGLSLDFLDSYWTRFLRQHAQPVKRVAEGQPVEKAGNRWFPAIPIPRLRR